MSPPAAQRRKLARGPIEAHAVYPLATFIQRLGIGRSSLTVLRRRGLKLRMIGSRCFVDGAEAVEALRRIWAEDEAGQAGEAPQ